MNVSIYPFLTALSDTLLPKLLSAGIRVADDKEGIASV